MRAGHKTSRTGFTLVETLVAAALTMSIMALLAGAFQVGLAAMRQMKVTGDMQERLRSAAAVIRDDLARPHFGGETLPGTAAPPALSGHDLAGAWAPPDQGFFRIWQGLGGDVTEGSDAEGNTFTRSAGDGANGHILHFTIRRDPNLTMTATSTLSLHPQQLAFSAKMPLGILTSMMDGNYSGLNTETFYSDWAEVIYFLTEQAGETTNGPGTPRLFTLRRQQRLLVPGATETSPAGPITASVYPEISVTNASTRFLNRPWDVSMPFRRLGANPAMASGGVPSITPLTGPNLGSDIVLSDVISFEIKVATEPPLTTPGSEMPFFYLPAATGNSELAGQHVFDTWSKHVSGVTPPYDFNYETGWGGPVSGTSIPQRGFRIWALQIRLRIWDVKSQTARQATIVQDV